MWFKIKYDMVYVLISHAIIPTLKKKTLVVLLLNSLLSYIALKSRLDVSRNSLFTILSAKHCPNYFCVVPNESCKRRVSLESRYGMCFDLPSTSAEITLPRAESDRLIFVASLRRSPVAPAYLIKV